MWRTCRFCGQSAHAGRLVKYEVRHYAHADCYLDRKPLSSLQPWQVGQISWRVLRQRGLIEEAARILRRDELAAGK